MQAPAKLELHYFLRDKSHSMDAFVKNKCDTELLAIANELISELNLDISIETEALKIGSVKDFWQATKGKKEDIALFFSVMTFLITIPSAINSFPDKELIELQKKESKLSIETMKRNAKEAKKNTEDLELLINNNYKIDARKSNFYKQLAKYPKVTQIGVSQLSKENRIIGEEKVIKRLQFKGFILQTNKLETIVDENARIEITGPILDAGKSKWKGLYEGETITFNMKDQSFKQSVLSRKTSFSNGSYVICILEIEQEIDDIGEIKKPIYNVKTVLDEGDQYEKNETKSGKKYRYETKQSKKLKRK